MNAIDRIKDQLSAAPVVLYMKGTPDFPQCGFSAQTVGRAPGLQGAIRAREHIRGSRKFAKP